MSIHEVLEVFRNDELSFDFSGDYISDEELEKNFFTRASSTNVTKSYPPGNISSKLKEGIITGLLCKVQTQGNLYRKQLYIYKKDYNYVIQNYYDSTIDFASVLDCLSKLSSKTIKSNVAESIFNKMGMFEFNPLDRTERRVNKVKFEDYKVNLIELNKNFMSHIWVEEQIKQKCLGYKPFLGGVRKQLGYFFTRNDYEVLEFNSHYNLSRVQKYSIEGCHAYIKEFMNNCVTYIRGDNQLFKTLETFKKEDLKNLYYTFDQFNGLLNKLSGARSFDNYRAFNEFKANNINVVRFKSLLSDEYLFFRKEEVDKLIAESMKFIDTAFIRNELVDVIDSLVTPKFLESRNIKIYKAPTFLLKERSSYIKKTDLASLKEQLLHENKLKVAESIYTLYKVLLVSEKIELKDIDLINKFDEYVLERSNNSNARYIRKMALVYIRICNILNDNIKSNVMQLPLELKAEKAESLIQLALDKSNDIGKYMRAFLKASYIPDVDLTIIKEKKIQDGIDKFSDDNFTTLLVSILDILDNPYKFKKLLYDRTSSSVILYVFVHYVFAWRRSSFLEELPRPNLKLIGYDDGLEFLEDLKNDIFVFEEYHGEKICKDITEYIYRKGLEASKNNQQLEGSIPSNLYQYLGLIMCICEGNRQYCEKSKRKNQNTEFLISPGSVKQKFINQTFSSFGIDIVGILGKPFGNRRGNKSFFSVLGERFDELKVCVLKAVKDLRSHKENEKGISTTGVRYYLYKDISKATIEIIAKETMGSVKDYLLKLTDENYELLDDEKQLKVFESLKLNTLDIEKIHKSLYETTLSLEEFFKSFYGDKQLSQRFIKELLYGKAYAKHPDCKCLLKAKINAYNNIEFKEEKSCSSPIVCPFRTTTCIGCSYLVALRLFIYEFKELLNDFFIQFENLKDIESRKLYANVFTRKYKPLLSEFKKEVGDELFKNVFNEEQYISFRNKIMEIKTLEKET